MSAQVFDLASLHFVKSAKIFIEDNASPELTVSWNKWDSLVSNFIYDTFNFFGFPDIYSPSPVTKDLFLVSSPTLLITAIIAYLLCVLLGVFMQHIGNISGIKGASDVKSKDSFVMKAAVFMHNLFLVILSTYMFTTTVYLAVKGRYNLWGNAYHIEDVAMTEIIYIFYASKLYEFFDTIIMLIRGNIHQVSFLHVYHHVSISIIWWMITFTYPGGDAYYTCALNSFVHILMYTYYLISTILGKNPSLRKKYLWWGKYMTQFQMLQFMSNTVQAAYCYFYSPYPKFMSAFLFLYMQTLLILFGNFYMKKHLFSRSRKNKEN